ncbi:MAG: hypothetical protein BWX73_03075 [Lentisphaerae bacterium ADurb.Bin082]|nr:MAG: hypothetical protein BWX73_03075 [Lentisphaerae bacterium ADurb.Bin082]
MEVRPGLGRRTLVDHADRAPGLLAGLDAAVDRGALGKHGREGARLVNRHVGDNGVFGAVPGPAHKVAAGVGNGLVGNLGASVNQRRIGAGAGVEGEFSAAVIRDGDRAEQVLAWLRLHHDVADAHEHGLQVDAVVDDVAHGEFALCRLGRVVKPAAKPIAVVGNRSDSQREFRMQLLADAGERAAADRGRGRHADHRLVQGRELQIVDADVGNGAAGLCAAVVLPFDEAVAIKGRGSDSQVSAQVGGVDFGDAAAGLAGGGDLGLHGDRAGFDEPGGVDVVPRLDVDGAVRAGAVIVQPLDEAVVLVRDGPDADLCADVMALARLVVLPLDLELAGAVGVWIDLQGQVRLGDERRRELVGRIVRDGLCHLGRGAASAIAAILPVPSLEPVGAHGRGPEPDLRANVDMRAPALIQDDLLAGAIGLPHLQQTAVFLAGRDQNRQARLLVECRLRGKALGLVPVESDRQVRAVDLEGNDSSLVKLPSGEAVRFRIRDADGVGDGSVEIEFGQNPLAAGNRDFAGIAGVGDRGVRRGINVSGEIAMQGDVLAADDGAVNVRSAVAPAGEDIPVQSRWPEFEHGVLGNQAALGVGALRVTRALRPHAALAEGDLDLDRWRKHGLEVIFGLVAILVLTDLELHLRVGAVSHVLAGDKVIALPFHEHIAWGRLGSELHLLAD